MAVKYRIWYDTEKMRVKYKFCPQCKNKLTKKDGYPHCIKCNQTIFLVSHPAVGILPIKNGKVLLTKRAIEPFKGLYDTIGGFLKDGGSPLKGAHRETKEETGLDIKVIDLLGIYNDKYGKDGDNLLGIVYIVKIIKGKIKPQDDVASLHWFPIEDTPQMAFKSENKTMRDLQKWWRKNGQLLTGFQNSLE